MIKMGCVISFPQQFFRHLKANLRLAVPDGLEFVIKTGSADISISAGIGRSNIASGSGDITVGNAVDLDCRTGSGDISVARVEGNAARLNSGSGDISVNEAYCPVTAKSGSGAVAVISLRGDLQANSGSGDIGVAADERLSRPALRLGLSSGRGGRQPARLDRPEAPFPVTSGSPSSLRLNPDLVSGTSRSGPVLPPATSPSTAPRSSAAGSY